MAPSGREQRRLNALIAPSDDSIIGDSSEHRREVEAAVAGHPPCTQVQGVAHGGRLCGGDPDALELVGADPDPLGVLLDVVETLVLELGERLEHCDGQVGDVNLGSCGRRSNQPESVRDIVIRQPDR